MTLLNPYWYFSGFKHEILSSPFILQCQSKTRCADEQCNAVQFVIPVTLVLWSITVNVVFYHHILPHLSHSPAPISRSLSLSLSAPVLPLPHTHTLIHTQWEIRT